MEDQISVIIPILNEVDNILNLLHHLDNASANNNIAEYIVVDGGSTDGSLEILKTYKNGRSSSLPTLTVIHSGKGRAKQMNKGAEHAIARILYFLHADSFPPAAFDSLIINEVANENLAGCFRMKFSDKHWWLQFAGWLTRFNWRLCRGGDQSLFIAKELFEEIGRYDESYIIYEDNDLITKLYARNQFVVIQKWILTSARLYREKGIWNLQYHFAIIYLKKWQRASPVDLYTYYSKHIKVNQPPIKSLGTAEVVSERMN